MSQSLHSLTYQTAQEYVSSPYYRKASSVPEYFDNNNTEEKEQTIKADPFEINQEEDDNEQVADEFMQHDSDPFSEVDEFLSNDSDPFTHSDIDPFTMMDIDPFLMKDVDPFLVTDDLFEEIDEFNEDDMDPFMVDDVDVFRANGPTDEGVITDPFLAEEGAVPYEFQDGEDPFLIEEDCNECELDEFEGEDEQNIQTYPVLHCITRRESLFNMVMSLQNLGLLSMLIALLILLVNH